MDYSDYSHQQSHQSQPSQRVWPPHLLTPSSQQPHPAPQSQQQQQQQQQQQVPFPSPVSPAGPFLFPGQSPSQQQQPCAPQTSPTTDPRPTASGLSLNLSGLSVASPPSLSPIGSHQAQPGQLHPLQLHAHHSIPHQPHHTHSHSHSSGSSISPITPISPPNMPLLSPQPQFSFGFDDAVPSSGGLSPAPDPVLSQRRPSTGSHTPSSSELAVEKSVPRKRSLTNAVPVSASTTAHGMHQHSHSHSYSSSHTGQAGQHALPHPIITTTASSPPLPTSPTSSPSSHPSHSHSRSLSHSHSHSSLSHSSLSHSHSPQRPHPQLEINPNPTSPYDEIDSAGPGFGGLGDDGSDDDFGSPSGSFSAGGNANSKASGSSGQQGQNIMGKATGTNNFVTKLYHMINDAKSQHFITWTDLGTSFVVSNVSEFSRSILGSHFKHNNFSSFVRQLNMYGFHKINRTPRAQRTSSSSQSWEFSHPKFLRGRPDLLEVIKRKALEPDPRERNRVELPGEVARLLSELRDENRALWREIRTLGSRIPQPTANHGLATISANFGGSSQGPQSHIPSNAQVGLGGEHDLTHSRSSSNLGGDDGERDADWEEDDGMNASIGSGPMTGIAMGLGGSQGGEEWDAQGPRFNMWPGGGLNVPGFAFNAFGTAPGGEEWKRWAEGEIIKERKRVERLVGVIKALVEVTGKGGASAGSASSGGAAVSLGIDREQHGIPPSILQELHELSLSFDTSPSPMSMAIPSPSPSPSPHPFTRHQYSPNIFITSPTSPSPYPGSHSRSPSRESQTHTNPNTHTTLPTLSIPNQITTNPSQFPLHTPSSSPTTSDFVPGFFRQGTGHVRGGRVQRQPNITLTLEMDENGRMEKRARTECDKVKDVSDAGMRAGEEMDIVPSEAGEDSKLPSPMSLTGGTSPTTGAGTGLGSNKVMGLRSRSDSAPMWGGEGSPVQGGLSANWLGRGRSG